MPSLDKRLRGPLRSSVSLFPTDIYVASFGPRLVPPNPFSCLSALVNSRFPASDQMMGPVLHRNHHPIPWLKNRPAGLPIPL